MAPGSPVHARPVSPSSAPRSWTGRARCRLLHTTSALTPRSANDPPAAHVEVSCACAAAAVVRLRAGRGGKGCPRLPVPSRDTPPPSISLILWLHYHCTVLPALGTRTPPPALGPKRRSVRSQTSAPLDPRTRPGTPNHGTRDVVLMVHSTMRTVSPL